MTPEELTYQAFELYRKIRNMEGVTTPRTARELRLCGLMNRAFMRFSRRKAVSDPDYYQ